MALKYFGTDGIRGEYGGPSLNEGIAFRAGVAIARLLKKQHEIEAPLMVVGRDTRASGLNLIAALGAGFRSEGVPSSRLVWRRLQRLPRWWSLETP